MHRDDDNRQAYPKILWIAVMLASVAAHWRQRPPWLRLSARPSL